MLTLGLTALGLLLGGWLLYPAGLWLATRLRPRELDTPPSGDPDVEVIIATRDAPEAVRRRVENLLASDYPVERLRVTVALDATAASALDHMQEALNPLPGVCVVLRDEPGGKAAALNAGVRAARAGTLVFTDTAQSFDSGTIRALVRCLDAPGVVGASGYLAARGDRGALGGFWAYETTLRALESRLDSLVGVTGAVYALRRAAWVPLREGLINDDMAVPLLVRRAGGRVIHCPTAIARDPREFTRDQQFARRVRTLTGVWQLFAWYPWLMVPGVNPLWLEFACHKVIRLLTPVLILVGAIGLLPLLPMWLVATASLVTAGGFFAGALVMGQSPTALVQETAWALRLLFVAPTVASWHGLRGRWGVWQPAYPRRGSEG